MATILGEAFSTSQACVLLPYFGRIDAFVDECCRKLMEKLKDDGLFNDRGTSVLVNALQHAMNEVSQQTERSYSLLTFLHSHWTISSTQKMHRKIPFWTSQNSVQLQLLCIRESWSSKSCQATFLSNYIRESSTMLSTESANLTLTSKPRSVPRPFRSSRVWC